MNSSDYKELKEWLNDRGEVCPSTSMWGSLAWHTLKLKEYKEWLNNKEK